MLKPLNKKNIRDYYNYDLTHNLFGNSLEEAKKRQFFQNKIYWYIADRDPVDSIKEKLREDTKI